MSELLYQAFRRDQWSLLLGGGAALIWWLAPQAGWADFLLGATMLGLGFVSPSHGLMLLAWVAPFEGARELAGLGTVHTTEMLLVAFMPGTLWSLGKHRAWQKATVPIASWWLPFAVVLTISALFSCSAISAKGALRWLEFVLAMVLGLHVLRQGRDAQRVVFTLLAAACVSAIRGLYETGSGVGIFPQALTLHTLYGEVVRAGAGFGPNTLALFLVMLLPFAWAAALFAPQGSARFMGLVASGCLLAGLLATFSLTGLLALALALVVVWIFLVRYFPRLAWWWAVAAVAGASGWLAFHPHAISGPFWETKLISWQDRLGYVQVVGQMLERAPFFGIGPGVYRYLAPGYWATGINPIGLLTHPHSLYLSLLAELGVLGLAAFLWILGRMGITIGRRLAQGGQLWPMAAGWGMAAGLAGFFSGNLSEHGLIHDRGVQAALMLSACLVFLRRPPRPRPMRPGPWFDRAWAAASLRNWKQELAGRPASRPGLYALLAQGLRENKRAQVLELGCGSALDAMNLARSYKAQVHGLDASGPALGLARTIARRLSCNLKLHQGDVRHTGLASESFDLVFSQGVLEHFPEPAPLWQEMHRLLKPQGYAVVDVPQAWNPYTLAKWFHHLKGDWPWGWETHYTAGDLFMQAQAWGFRAQASQGYGYRGGPLDVTAWLRKHIQPRWPDFWEGLEKKTGAHWMMNVVVLVQKAASGET